MNKFINEVFSKLADKKILVNFTVELIFFILKLAFCIFIYYVAIKVLKKLTPLFNIKKKDDLVVDKSLKSFIKSILNVGVHALLITVCLLIMGVKESSLLAFFGTLGIGVGLALKDNLSNFAGGIIIPLGIITKSLLWVFIVVENISISSIYPISSLIFTSSPTL